MVRAVKILVAHCVPRARLGGMSRIMGFMHDRIVEHGHEVSWFCSDDLPTSLAGRLSRLAFPILLRRHIVAAAKDRPYDLVNVHEPSAAAVTTCRRTLGVPLVVVTSHGIERRGWELALEDRRLARNGPHFKTRLVYPATVLWQADMSLRLADHVFCLNSQDREYLTGRMGRPRESVTIIQPGAAKVFAESGRARSYERADRLLFAGSWIARKGTTDLVQAFVMLARRSPGLTLTVLGPGIPEGAVLDSFPVDLRPKVRCVYTSSDAEAASVLSSADIFVLPSVFEGTPLTLIEAMASGLPIVTTATCGMKDVIVDGTTGILVPIRSPESIAAALERLVRDLVLRTGLGHAARAEAARRFTWEQSADQVRAVYEQLRDSYTRS